MSTSTSLDRAWITTVPAWPSEFVHRDMTEVGMELSRLLRGEEHKCDIILALTHSRCVCPVLVVGEFYSIQLIMGVVLVSYVLDYQTYGPLPPPRFPSQVPTITPLIPLPYPTLPPQDISLAHTLHAHAHTQDQASKHGVDILFGGHDHIYYIGRGVDSWGNYTHVKDEPGTELDDGVR